jgi:hypothetical protein
MYHQLGAQAGKGVPGADACGLAPWQHFGREPFLRALGWRLDIALSAICRTHWP